MSYSKITGIRDRQIIYSYNNDWFTEISLNPLHEISHLETASIIFAGEGTVSVSSNLSERDRKIMATFGHDQTSWHKAGSAFWLLHCLNKVLVRFDFI